MSSLAWQNRPLEERTAFNPAFLALLLRQATEGYQQEAQGPLPVPLAFVVLPLVLHRPTREALPNAVSTSLPVWLQGHPLLRQGFPQRARSTAAAVREALVIGLGSGVLRLAEGALEVGDPPRPPRRATGETRRILQRARFVGRWMGRAGDVETIFFLWGIRP